MLRQCAISLTSRYNLPQPADMTLSADAPSDRPELLPSITGYHVSMLLDSFIKKNMFKILLFNAYLFYKCEY